MASDTGLDILYDFLDQEPVDLDEGLALIREILEVKHVVYHAARLGAKAVDDPFIRLTYPADWVKRYLTQGYMRVDPVIREGFQRAVPFDWAEITLTTEDEILFFEDASNHDIGRSGLSLPVRDKDGRRALFTVSSDLTGDEWRFFKRDHLNILVDVAHIFHARAVKFQEGKLTHPPISARERDVLYWAAQGKTAYEVAVILGLAEPTVTSYLRSARYKLDSTSTTQAVYKAQTIGIIQKSNGDSDDEVSIPKK